MTQHPPESSGTRLDLMELDGALRQEPAYERSGHTARTLIRTDDLRSVLVALRAGARIDEHQAANTITIHVVRGRVRVQLDSNSVELGAAQLLSLSGGQRHAVEALEESAFVLTLAWKA